MTPRSTSLQQALPQADAGLARLRRGARAALRCGLPGRHGGGWRLEVGAARPLAGSAVRAEVFTAGGSLHVAFDAHHWPALASASRMPDGPQRDTVAALLVGNRCPVLAGWIAGIRLATDTPPPRASGVALCQDDLRLDVLQATDSVLAALQAACAGIAAPLDAATAALRLPCRLQLAHRHLSRQALHRLRDGDVLLLPPRTEPHSPDTADGPAWLSWGAPSLRGLRAPVRLRNSTMTLASAPLIHQELPALDSALAQPAADMPLSGLPLGSAELPLGRVELPVSFELAGPLLTLSDIAALSADDVLELPVPIDHAEVRLIVAQQLVAVGELVAVGGRLGVRVLRKVAVP